MNIYTDYGFCPDCGERRELCQCDEQEPIRGEFPEDDNRILTLQACLDAAAEVLQVFAQFHNITEEYENEYVQVRVPVSALHEARRLLGGAFRDLSNSEDIPV